MTNTISCKLKFIYSAGCMPSSSWNLANKLATEIHKIKFKYGDDNNKYKTCELNIKCVSAVNLYISEKKLDYTKYSKLYIKTLSYKKL